MFKILFFPVSVAVVGLERTFYSVSEDVGVVEVCAIVHVPDDSFDCPIMFPFEVNLSTDDDTAGIYISGIAGVFFLILVSPLFSVSNGLWYSGCCADVCCLSEKELCEYIYRG